MYDVVVVGAGLSGLVTVYTLLKRISTLEILVVEKEMICGGQITERGTNEDNRWFSLDQKQLIGLCKELNVAYGQYPQMQKNFHSIWEFKKKPFACLIRWELQRFMDYFDLMTTLARTDRSDN